MGDTLQVMAGIGVFKHANFYALLTRIVSRLAIKKVASLLGIRRIMKNTKKISKDFVEHTRGTLHLNGLEMDSRKVVYAI